MRKLPFSSTVLVVAMLAGCAQTPQPPFAPPGGGGRPPFRCDGNQAPECELDVQPNGQWVPTLIEAKKNPTTNKYPKIRWKLDPHSPFKFVGQGIFFEGEAAGLFACRVHGNRKHVTCDNNAPQTPEAGKYRYRVQIELDPFVWNN